MSLSGAGWPAGGLVSGAGTAAGRADRSGERTDPVPGGVRPVAPAQAAGERAGRGAADRRAAGHAEAGRPDAGRPEAGRRDVGGADAGGTDAGRANPGRANPGDRGAPDGRGAAGPGGRGLVPVGAAQPPVRPGGSPHQRVPVASVPQLSAPIGVATGLGLQTAGASAPALRAPGSWSDGIWPAGAAVEGALQPWALAGADWTSGRTPGGGAAPTEAAAVSDSYRKRGGLPQTGVAVGRIFRVSV